MINSLIALAIFSSLLLVQDGDLSVVNSRNWFLPNLRMVQARLVGINQGEVSLERESGELISVPFRELTSADQAEVMRQTGWGRVWEDSTGEHFFIADLVTVKGDQVFLENIDGDLVSYEIDRLSRSDKQYVEARRRINEADLPRQFTGKVVEIHDGDSITVLLNNRRFRIRLEGIDAPESGQDYGRKAKQFLSDLIFNKSVVGTRTGGDEYGRNLCVITINGLNVNQAMVAEGLAWHYKRFSNDSGLAAAEDAARNEKKNIWSERGPIPPWDWRKWSSAQRKNFQERNASRLAATGAAGAAGAAGNGGDSDEQADGLTHWLNTKSDVRHNSGCRWFKNSQFGRPCTATEGKPCQQCGG